MAATTTSLDARQRAAALRLVARQLDGLNALHLHRRAGHEVWIGPTPQRCLDDLLRLRRSLLTAADQVRAAARHLDQRAAELDANSS